jgi:hypothetical protein
MENIAGEEVNRLTQLLSDINEPQPRKVEELLPDDNIMLNTYIIFPTGGYHPFHGIPGTPPRYQQRIWPYVKRIKFNKKFKNDRRLNNLRRVSLRDNTTLSQINPYLEGDNYFKVALRRTVLALKNDYTVILKKSGKHKYYKDNRVKGARLHRLVALAWIPNLRHKPFVMHLNDDPTNYLIENLKWGTPRENSKGQKKKALHTMEQKYSFLVNKGVIRG